MKKISVLIVLFVACKAAAQTNNSLLFNGSSQYVSIGNPVATGSSYTMEAWVYASSLTGSRNIVSSSNASLWIDGGKLSAGNSGGGTDVVDAATFPSNRWVHVAVTYDQSTSTMVLYKDGVLINTSTSVSSYTGASTYIASSDGTTGYFDGKIDEVRIWNVPLSQADIKKRLHEGPPKTTSGLVRLYKFNETSGTVLVDSVSSANGTLMGPPVWSPSPVQKSPNALDFDGSNDQVIIPHTVSGDFTVEYWMKTTQVGPSGGQWYNGAGIVDAEVGGVTADWGTTLTGSKLAFGIGSPDITIFSSSDVNTGSWVHIAATRSQSTGAFTLYVNGVAEASGTAGTGTRSAPGRIAMGMLQTGANFYQGALDEVRIWSVVRSASQIAANMNAEIDPAVEPNLLAYYTFNQGIANGTNTGLTGLIDQKNSNNGTLNNFALGGTSSNYVMQFSSITPLPLTWLGFKVTAQNDKALLSWSTVSERETRDFVVKHSVDGYYWNDIGTLKAKGNYKGVSQYSFVHGQPEEGYNFYRILQRDLDNSAYFSQVQKIYFGPQGSAYNVNNPVTDGQLRLIIPQDDSKASLRTTDGRILWQAALQAGQTTVDVSGLPAGVYMLIINNEYSKIAIQ